jgi:hypothetical protein
VLNGKGLYSIEPTKENIELPKIPIYLSKYVSLNSKLFIKVYDKNESFYNLYFKYKKKKYKRDPSWITGTLPAVSIVYPLFAVLLAQSYDGETREKTKIVKNQIYFSSAIFCILGFTISYFTAPKIPKNDIYNVSIENQNNKIIFSKIIKCEHNQINKEIFLDEDLKKIYSKNLTKYEEIINKKKKYEKSYDFNKIYRKKDKELSLLFEPKGEFETTQQYKERISKDNLRKIEILAKYEQNVRLAKEQHEIKRYKILQDIKVEIKKVEFVKNYNYNVSKYNPDKQIFIFTISGTHNRDLIVPINKAKNFKSNINNYKVQKIFKPTLYGTWETVSDDYVLINTKTDEIIPWEGDIPTYVETAVENPPILSASVKLIEPSGEGYLDAEETAIIQITLNNSGKGSAKKTRISLFQQEGATLYYDVSNTINEILPNQSITSEFKLTVPENIESGNVEFKISFLEEQGFEPASLNFTAETRAMLKPELILADFGVDDANGDGKISKGETADITLRLQNIGQGKAKKVSLDVIEDRLVNLFIISEKHFDLGNLESGESKDITFTISTNKRVSDVVNINFNIQEKRQQFSIEDNIALELEKTQKQLEPIVFFGKDVKTEIIDVTGLSIDIEQDIPQTSKTNENALAIIFGIESYKNVSSVTHATRDANFVKEYLNKTFGIKKSNIYFKTNEDVGKAEFDKVFSKGGWLDKRVKEGKTEIYFYYAGHGAPDIKQNRAYLIPYDGDPNYASQTGYEVGKVYSNLADLGAKSVTVFLDACFSGANRESEMLLADARPIFIEVEGPVAHGITVFSATSSKEISSAWPEKKHGLFSYFLMKGMQGKADINNDNKLSLKELGDYIQQNVSERAGFLDREQTPQLITDDENRILINY